MRSCPLLHHWHFILGCCDSWRKWNWWYFKKAQWSLRYWALWPTTYVIIILFCCACKVACIFTSSVMQLSRLVSYYPSKSRFCFIRYKPHLSSFTDSTVFAITLPSGPFKESGKRQLSSLIDATFSSGTCKHLPTLTIAPGRSPDSYVWCFLWRENAENSSLILLRNSTAVYARSLTCSNWSSINKVVLLLCC